MTLAWPIDILAPRNVSFDIQSRSLAGPSSVSGFRQVVASDAGIWMVTFGEIDIREMAQALKFREIDTLLEGQLNPILVPFCQGYQPALTVATATAAVAARAVSMVITATNEGQITPGQSFSIGERMYRVRSYNTVSNVLTFRPPLREAVTLGAALAWQEPVCRMRLASDQEMNLELQLRRYAQPTVRFIEDL